MSLCLTRRLDCCDVKFCPPRKETLSDRDCRYCDDRGNTKEALTSYINAWLTLAQMNASVATD
jgi:radical SAM superfamily enzyme